MKRSVAGPPFPSATFGEEIDSSGGSSSSAMVPVAVAAGSVARDGALNLTTTVSSGSSAPSPVTATAMVLLVSPARKVSVPAAMAA